MNLHQIIGVSYEVAEDEDFRFEQILKFELGRIGDFEKKGSLAYVQAEMRAEARAREEGIAL